MPEKSHSFPRSHRLSGRLAFAAVYAAGVKYSRGPLVLFSRPNDLEHWRWGLSVSRRVGSAPARNRIKRLLRESARLLDHKISPGCDVILVVRPHDPLALADYQKLLAGLVGKAEGHWKRGD